MQKLVIKTTVYRLTDRDLYESLSGVPLRQRSAMVRQLCRQALESRRNPIAHHPTLPMRDAGVQGDTQKLDASELSGLIAFG